MSIDGNTTLVVQEREMSDDIGFMIMIFIPQGHPTEALRQKEIFPQQRLIL